MQWDNFCPVGVGCQMVMLRPEQGPIKRQHERWRSVTEGHGTQDGCADFQRLHIVLAFGVFGSG